MKHQLTWKMALVGIVSSLWLAGYLFPLAVQAKDEAVLKFSHQWVQGDIRDNWARSFISKVEKRAKGVKIELYAGSVLFKPQAQFDALRKGAIDLSIMPLGYMSGTYPVLTITDLPGVVSNPEQGLRFSHAEVGKRIEGISEAAGMKIVSWGWLPTSIGSKPRPIHLPSDVKGLKMRAAVKPIEMTFQAAGAAITTMPPGEVYMVLQTGALDAFFTTDSSFLSFRLYDVMKYLTLGKQNGLINGNFCIVMRPDTFKKLNPEQQKVVIEAGEEVEKEFLQEAKKISEEFERTFKEKGVQVSEMTEKEHAAWVELGKESAWKWFREQVKGGNEMLDLALKVR